MKKLVIPVAIAGLAIGLTACSSSPSAPAPATTVTPVATQRATTSDTPSQGSTWVPPGSVTSDGLTYQLMSARYATVLPDQYGCASPADQGYVCRYDNAADIGLGGWEVTWWQVTDDSSQPVLLNGSQFSDPMCGRYTATDFNQEAASFPALWGSNAQLIDNLNLAPGQTVQGGAIFDVPQGCTNRYVLVGSGEKVRLP